MWFVAVVLLLNVLVLACGKLNYCGAKMCSYTDAHTFCRFSNGPGPQCIGHVESPLTVEEKIRLVIRLNQRRASVASGRLRGYPPAGNMMKLLWMEELAREAQLWADQCEPPSTPEENDVCRDLYSVTIGQCVASVIGEAPGLRPESMVDMWYMQNMFYKGNVTSYDAPINNRHNYYGDFAQLLYSKTYMVGCGRSRFMVLKSGRLRSVERLVCNFAPRGPAPGKPLWTVASPGTACPPRSASDDNVPVLCTIQYSFDQTQDEDDMMSLEEHSLLETVFEIQNNESLNYLGSLDEIYLTKVAVATIADIVNTPMAMDTSLQKRSFSKTFDKKNGKAIVEYQTTETYKPETKVVFIGRPKSYNIEELSEDNYKMNNNNPGTKIQDLPIRMRHFNVDHEFNADYEFSENIEQRTTNIEKTTTTRATSPSNNVEAIITYENTDSSTIKTTSDDNLTIRETTSTFGITPYTEPLNVLGDKNIDSVNKFSDYDNLTLSENETDALLDEYLSDPETVKRLQEELYRMEQAMSSSIPQTETQPTTTERADKVRRSLKDENDVINGEQYNRSFPELMGMFSKNGNSTNPVMSMAMKYIPYFKDYKSSILSNADNNFNRKDVGRYCILCGLFSMIYHLFIF